MENSTIPIHGLTTDAALIRASVVDKFVENSEHIAKIVFWSQDINGQIWICGEIEVVLPSKNKCA